MNLVVLLNLSTTIQIKLISFHFSKFFMKSIEISLQSIEGIDNNLRIFV